MKYIISTECKKYAEAYAHILQVSGITKEQAHELAAAWTYNNELKEA